MQEAATRREVRRWRPSTGWPLFFIWMLIALYSYITPFYRNMACHSPAVVKTLSLPFQTTVEPCCASPDVFLISTYSACTGQLLYAQTHAMPFMVNESGSYEVDTLGCEFDTLLSITKEDCSSGEEVACSDDVVVDGHASYCSALTVNLEANVRYFVLVSRADDWPQWDGWDTRSPINIRKRRKPHEHPTPGPQSSNNFNGW